NTLLTESIVPWHRGGRTTLDEFYSEKGYFPALKPGEKETVSEVNAFERRQSVATTIATSFDDWCVYSMILLKEKSDPNSEFLAHKDLFLKRSQNVLNLYNEKTGFFHPKDSDGNFIEPFDYRISGGLGFRDYYDENNAWTYRWEPAAFLDLVSIMGGEKNFERNLDETFLTPIGMHKWRFWGGHAPDQTGNVGQSSMGNEPSFLIPYLYNRAGAPWKTQKAIRALINTWFRDDLMGVPGDEDGGAMSAFVVWSMLGLYPNVGKGDYEIGSPFFDEAEITLESGKKIKILAKNNSRENKYVKSLKLGGEEISSSQISHGKIKDGAVLEFEMGNLPIKNIPQKKQGANSSK
ncbi:MAG: GH92 family glycosyl hydrolase, partial [Opitutales bacterium]|nr:GH92 family glycosyl hydrolase [Opitutales bacterium]